ncbi:MAG: ribbon-helix-helix protein, CopG family [Candidatus Nanohaloarchaea archaeon]
MYSLKKNTTEGLFDNSGRKGEKEDHNVYLLVSQWEALDSIADEEGISRNKVLREILNDYLNREVTERDSNA